METPKAGDTIIIKFDSGQFTEGIADVEKPRVSPVKGQIDITIITKNVYEIEKQYSIVFKDGTESLAVMMCSTPSTQHKGIFRTLFSTAVPK